MWSWDGFLFMFCHIWTLQFTTGVVFLTRLKDASFCDLSFLLFSLLICYVLQIYLTISMISTMGLFADPEWCRTLTSVFCVYLQIWSPLHFDAMWEDCHSWWLLLLRLGVSKRGGGPCRTDCRDGSFNVCGHPTVRRGSRWRCNVVPVFCRQCSIACTHNANVQC